MKLHFLHGTETGNSEMLCEDMVDDLGIEAEITSLGDMPPADLDADTFYIIVTSTYGNGDLPATALPFSDALRDETPLPNDRLESLRTFTLQVVRQRGNVTDDQVAAFLDAGYTKRQILEVILGVAQKVMSNYTNHLAKTPVDKPMQAFAWERRQSQAA